MAKLQSGHLTLGIKFTRLEEEWVAYEFSFLWKDEPIINDEIFKTGRWWDKRRHGTFLANDYEKDYLIEIIKKVLETKESDYWEPIEPDVKIAIYPDMYFPFLKEKLVSNDAIDISKEELFTIMVFMDTYNFIDCNSYSSEGVSLNLIVRRKDLEEFVTELESEYIDFIKEI